MENDEVKVFVCTHKKFDFDLPDYYNIIQVGSEISQDLGYIRDDTFDNISKLNKNFCELTGLYWIWKNDDANIVGLVHYRRYFFKNFYDACRKKVIDKRSIKKILNEYDIILPKKWYYNKTTEEIYAENHKIEDYYITREVIEEKYADYIESFDRISTSKESYLFNMFCCKKELIDQYCEWLFDIMFELKNRIDISNYDDYNKRIFGFLSERLFNVWLDKNNLKIKELYVFNIENENIMLKYMRQKLKRLIKR